MIMCAAPLGILKPTALSAAPPLVLLPVGEAEPLTVRFT